MIATVVGMVSAWLMLATAWAAPAFAGSLADRSPLAVTGDRLFAVAGDGATIVTRPTSLAGGWEPLKTDLRLHHVGGLAAGDNALFVSEQSPPSIIGIDLRTGRHDLLARGEPLRRPADLAVDDVLFVADTDAGEVFRITFGRDGGRPEPVTELRGTSSGSGALAYSNGTLVYAEQMAIVRLVAAARTDGRALKTLQRADEASNASSSSTGAAARTTYKGAESTEYPTIDRPLSVAAVNGLVYAVSGTTGRVYVTPRLVRRAINGTFGVHPGDTTTFRRIALSPDWLFALDDQGEVARWPRPVPVQLTIETPRSECLSAFFAYLEKREALPSRPVNLQTSIEQTLKKEGVLTFPYVTALDTVLCHLNPDLCHDGRPKRVLSPTTKLNIPDLFVEGVLANRPVQLKGGRTTLAQTIKDNVRSEEFAYALEEKTLRKINFTPDSAPPLLTRREGEFIVPKELVRYTIAVPAEDVVGGVPGPAFADIKRRCAGVTINPLERRDRSASQTPTPAPPCAAGWQDVDGTHDTLLKTIHVGALPEMPLVSVAIVESDIDETHPDFLAEDGTTPFDHPDEPLVPAAPAVTPSPSVRCWDDDDHGTAVTSLIGAQRWRGTTASIAGLATQARLRSVPTDFSQIDVGFEDTINFAVTNVSRKSEAQQDPNFEAVLKQNGGTLFVIAAGNGSGAAQNTWESCSRAETNLYPACYDDRDNVLVVGATTLDGSAWLDANDTDEGSFWSPRHVHVAAPGVGYWAPGRGNAYVRVRGSSFATPLVAATAARLMAQGFGPPWHVKYRLIATARSVPALRGKVMGGVLDVERALTRPQQTTLVRGHGDHATEQAAFLLPHQTLQLKVDGIKRSVPLEKILRLTWNDPTYRMVFENELERLEISDDVKIPPNAVITYKPVDPNGKVLPQKNESLNGIDDFVAALPTWAHNPQKHP